MKLRQLSDGTTTKEPAKIGADRVKRSVEAGVLALAWTVSCFLFSHISFLALCVSSLPYFVLSISPSILLRFTSPFYSLVEHARVVPVD